VSRKAMQTEGRVPEALLEKCCWVCTVAVVTAFQGINARCIQSDWHLVPGVQSVWHLVPGLGSTALVLSIAAPFGGSNWYWLTLLSPLAGAYYLQKGNRQEEVCIAGAPPPP
jgi:Cofactor assembly of complex C subunit B